MAESMIQSGGEGLGAVRTWSRDGVVIGIEYRTVVDGSLVWQQRHETPPTPIAEEQVLYRVGSHTFNGADYPVYTTVTFAAPMPDTNYFVFLNPTAIGVDETDELKDGEFYVDTKTTAGFRIVRSATIDYTSPGDPSFQLRVDWFALRPNSAAGTIVET